LRLVVAVPESLVGAMVKGARVAFTVPAYPGETFYGMLNLVAHDLDEKTRSMAAELDVKNPDLRLSPGMYPEVQWPVRRPQASLLVPPTSIVTTTERTFVIRVKNGGAEWAISSRSSAHSKTATRSFGGAPTRFARARRSTSSRRRSVSEAVSPCTCS
jgi:multidrug efflux pump subunit AcrA (membrane-fusion protein)